jgi:hypothetical protein
MDYANIHAAIERGIASDHVPRVTLSLLRDIAAGRCDLAAIRHPLGFLCLPTHRCGQYGVCVHLWTQEPRDEPTTSGVHSHSWDLVSYVLYGTIRNQRIEVTDARTATHRVFEVRSLGDVDELVATSRLVSCRSGASGVHSGGCVYVLPAGEFHTTVVADDEQVATVVLGRLRPLAADLSLGPVQARSHTVARSRCSARETARAARMIAERLEAAGAAHP